APFSLSRPLPPFRRLPVPPPPPPAGPCPPWRGRGGRGGRAAGAEGTSATRLPPPRPSPVHGGGSHGRGDAAGVRRPRRPARAPSLRFAPAPSPACGGRLG